MAAFDVNGLIGRATQWMAAAPLFAVVAPTVVPPLDRALQRLTGGRIIVGRTHHPAWTGNLIATPEATVSFEGRTTEVVARQLCVVRRVEVWPRLRHSVGPPLPGDTAPVHRHITPDRL